MQPLVDRVFPPIGFSRLPYWRYVLRGCSQLCLQSNELTGLLFLAAVLAASPIAFAYMLVAAAIAPGIRMALGASRETLETGLPGLNPCLIALSITSFFETGWTDYAMWGVLLVCVLVTVLIVHASVAVLSFPILAAPFMIVFGILFALASHLDFLDLVVQDTLPAIGVHPVRAVFLSMGQVAFSPSLVSGLLITVGLLVAGWRYAAVALVGAMVAAVVSIRDNVNPATINLGLYGFNAVLTAVAVYVLCDESLRLAILGAVLANLMVRLTGMFEHISLSLPFVLATWIFLALGRVERKWFVPAQEPGPSSLTGYSAKDNQS